MKWQGHISIAFKEEQTIQKGGVSSTGIFKAKANPCLDQLSDHPSSLHNGHIRMGELMVADDLVLMANMSNDVQELVSEAQLDASREWFNFIKTQTRSMLIGKKAKG